MGCFKDGLDRAIPTIEGTDPVLDGGYWIRENPVAKCAVAARRKGFNVFAIQDGGWCAASATAEETYGIYGRSTDCLRGGEGGHFASDVYVLDLG